MIDAVRAILPLSRFCTGREAETLFLYHRLRSRECQKPFGRECGGMDWQHWQMMTCC